MLGVLDSPNFSLACEWCYWTAEDEGLGERGEETGAGGRLKICTGCGVVRFCGVVSGFLELMRKRRSPIFCLERI